MKKTISGVLLALTAVFALVACGKKKTTTASKTGSGDDTTKQTTEKKDRKRSGKANTINFYCWNDEFKTRLNKFYSKVDSTNGSVTKLNDGNVIQWTMATNEGSVYQDTLDIALDNNMVDMYCFEADYATKYVKSEFALDMETLGVKSSMGNQYKYTQDIATNAEGKLVGSSWQATPGVTIYNLNVAKAVWGDTVTHAQMEEKLSTTFDAFKTAASEVKAANKNKYTLIGHACWYRTYGNNLSAKMYDGSKITIDKALFEYAKDTKFFADNEYIKSIDDDYGLWQGAWGTEQGADNCLCIFSCPWFTDFCLTGYRPLEDEDGNKINYGGEDGDSMLRVTTGYKTWFWGGTWLTATPVSQQESTIKDEIKNIIIEMTTKKETLLGIAKEYLDFTNDSGAMEDLGNDATANSTYFGGQNVYKIYADAVENCDLSKASDYDQQITEGFQAAFVLYMRGEKKASEAWDEFVKELKKKTSIQTIEVASGVTLGDDITFA